MKIAVSNIAWNAAENETVFPQLRQMGIHGLEAAPSRLWRDPVGTSAAEIDRTRQELAVHGFEVVALQSLLFGRDELKLFQDDTRTDLGAYLLRLAEIGLGLGSRAMVFGSPRQRVIPPEMPANAAWATAIDFFAQIGGKLHQRGMVLGIEPNPPVYGGNFIQTIDEASALVRAVASPGFRLHVDAGALQINGEDIETSIEKHGDLICHVHASEPMLAPLGSWAGHQRLADALRGIGYQGWVSLEMKRPTGGVSEVLESASRCLAFYS